MFIKKFLKSFVNYYELLEKIFIFNLFVGLVFLFFSFYLNKINIFIFILILSLILTLLLALLIIKIPYNVDRLSFLNLILSINLDKKNFVGVEVGVLEGKYSEKIMNFFKKKNKNLELWLVDPWISSDDYTEFSQKKLDDSYKKVVEKFKDNQNIKIIKDKSLAASDKFSNGSLDFVYVDGDHDYEHIKNDLNIWFKKLKKNGVLFGDDYARPYGVHKAVSEFCFENKLIVKFSDNYKQFAFIKN